MTDTPNSPDMPDLQSGFAVQELLPDDLSAVNPMHYLRDWIAEAVEKQITPNPNAMALATIDPDGAPSCRIVLCRKVDVDRGSITFFTNRQSRKGKALESDPRAAATFHWDAFDRQIRVEGTVERAPDADSDAYFASRGTMKAVAAWASEQSEPIDSRERMVDKANAIMDRFGVDPANPDATKIPRPPHWGGYRLVANSVEVWVGSRKRLHDRAVWRRGGGAWSAERLQP